MDNSTLEKLAILNSINSRLEKKSFVVPALAATGKFLAPLVTPTLRTMGVLGTPFLLAGANQGLKKVTGKGYGQTLAENFLPDTVQRLMGYGGEVVNAATTPASPGTPGAPILTPMEQGAAAAKQHIATAKNLPQVIKDSVESTYDTAKKGLGGLTGFLGGNEKIQNLASNYGLPILSLLALSALASNSKKKKEVPAGGQLPINININTGKNRSNLLGEDPMGVGSFSTYKYASYMKKKADIITDSLINAAKNRVANRVIDSVVKDKKEQKEHSETDKKIEILSKNPNIKKLLENEENKQYLEKLISEKS